MFRLLARYRCTRKCQSLLQSFVDSGAKGKIKFGVENEVGIVASRDAADSGYSRIISLHTGLLFVLGTHLIATKQAVLSVRSLGRP